MDCVKCECYHFLNVNQQRQAASVKNQSGSPLVPGRSLQMREVEDVLRDRYDCWHVNQARRETQAANRWC